MSNKNFCLIRSTFSVVLYQILMLIWPCCLSDNNFLYRIFSLWIFSPISCPSIDRWVMTLKKHLPKFDCYILTRRLQVPLHIFYCITVPSRLSGTGSSYSSLFILQSWLVLYIHTYLYMYTYTYYIITYI